MSVYKQPGSNYYSYRFEWEGKEIRRSTKTANKKVAEKIERRVRDQLAMGNVGIIEKKRAPTLADFAKADFLPFVDRTWKTPEPNTERFYRSCTTNLLSFRPLASARLDEINGEQIQAYIDSRKAVRQERRKNKPLEVSTINRDLATLKRLFSYAVELGRIAAAPKFKLLPGENRRERALSREEAAAYLQATLDLGYGRERAYAAALEGIRATVRGEQPRKPDAFQLHHVAVVLLYSALRPEECFRLKPENIKPDALWVLKGKTKAARRRIPFMDLDGVLRGVLEMRVAQTAPGEWLFPADTKSGHIESSSIKKQHAKALEASGVLPFEFYILRHTCLTNWGEYMDPAKLHYYAGHTDFKTTLRYIHPRDESMEEAMEKARAAQEARTEKGRHSFRHSGETGESTETGKGQAIN